MATTKKPTGLKVTRSDTDFVLSWTRGDDNYNNALNILVRKCYMDNRFNLDHEYESWYDQWVDNPEDRSETSHTFKNLINRNNFYPNHAGFYLSHIKFGVAGTATGKYWSDYAWVEYWLSAPSPPKVEASWSSEYANQSTFKWESVESSESHAILTDYEVQTILVKDCNTSDGSLIDWTGVESKSYARTEQTTTITESDIFYDYYSYTRWVRVRARGPAYSGEQLPNKSSKAWRYARHVYAFPTAPTDVSAIVNNRTDLGKYRVSIRWTAESTETHPIDSTTITYAQVTPRVKYEIKYKDNGEPYRHVELVSPLLDSGTDIATTKDSNSIVFTTNSGPETDKAFAVKVVTKHDNQTVSSDPIYVPDSFGKLSNPSNLVITNFNPITHRITINAHNNSSVPHTHMAIMFQPHIDGGKEVCVGIIHENTHLPITLTLPDISESESFSIGIKTRLGDFYPATEPGNYAYTECELTNTIMESDTVWDAGSIYIYTTPPTLSTPKVGTINVKWNWSWENATGAELSWSKDKDSWMSTNGPSTYLVYGTNNSEWNISGLDVGTWYVRVRLFKEADGGTVYGGHSAIGEIKLSSAPLIPNLTLSSSVIPQDGEVTCYWAYTSTDGTDQMQAEICTATIVNGVTIYGDIIARTSTTQHISLYAEDQGWEAGDVIYLAVRVISNSGEASEGWSPLATLSIANKQEIEIKNTSLVPMSEVIGSGAEAITLTYNAITTMPLTFSLGLKNLYVLSGDTVAVAGKTYYVKTGTDTYVEAPEYVPDPSSYYEKTETTIVVNPNALGYYEYSSNNYVLTTDTAWNDNKTYYMRFGSGTEGDPYRYVVADKPNTIEITYSQTSDTTWDETKTYYYRYETEEGIYDYKAVEMPVENPRMLSYYEQNDLDGEITATIERAEAYHLDRPDETEFDGFEGEIVAYLNQNGSSSLTIHHDSLIGVLDDDCRYRLNAMVTDTYGQTAYADPIDFVVKWAHQAVYPTATINVENDHVVIQPMPPSTSYEPTQDTNVVSGKSYYTKSGDTYTQVNNPSGNPHDLGYYQIYDYLEDTCDIYRLSVDKPTMIVRKASFNTKYVDLYPTLGTFGGYRIVYRTLNGDYTTSDKSLAWVDYTGNQINKFATIIDFGHDQVVLPYNLSISNKWTKDFTETKYLGGSVQGDWNAAVSRTSTVSTTVVVGEDQELVTALRRLAAYSGICHIRTPEGSNFLANVSVSEDREEKWVNKLAKVSLNITRVDSQVLDGVEYDQLFDN